MPQAALLPLAGELKPPYRPRMPQNSVYYRLVEEHFEQLNMACNLQYLDIDNNYSNRYEDDYSQLPAEELCSKRSTFR